ncbi:MAG: tRNA (cytidine(34)-2'-O)-methyltransferase [Planctomycetota bacterium]
MPPPIFHIVLLHPEIPNNTGNIGRTCAATRCKLHVIHPISFDMSEKARRRAGLEYWDLVEWTEHDSWDAFLEREPIERLFLYTTRSETPHWDAELRAGDYLLFGRETSGVPDAVHNWVAQRWGDEARITLPMVEDPRARSLNLATAVCTAIYEGLRQVGGIPPATS